MRFTYASVCSGIEAPSVAWSLLGWKPLWFAEIEPFPSAVLAHHHPEVPNYGDFTRLLTDVPATPDVLIGGTPCQAFSVAGLRGGLSDPRGNLALAFVALVGVLRPRWVVWENVPGVLSSGGGRDFGAFLGGLAAVGYGFAYRVLDAQYFGLAQRRERVFVVASPGNWTCPAQVLLEPEGVRGDPPARGEAGAGVTGAIGTGASGDGGWRVGADEAAAGHVVLVDTMVQTRGSNVVTGDVTGTLGTNSDRASGGAPCVLAIQDAGGRDKAQNGRGWSADDLAYTVDAANTQGVCIAGLDDGDLARSLNAHPSRYDLDTETLVAVQENNRPGIRDVDIAGSVRADAPGSQTGGPRARTSFGIRRLMPHELERLQGFPDRHTLVSYRGRPATDGPRAKALGNSMAVPVIRWIGRRIEMVESLADTAEAAK